MASSCGKSPWLASLRDAIPIGDIEPGVSLRSTPG